MKFVTPCYVCITDAKKRAELCAWLNEIGYSEAMTIFPRGNRAPYVWCIPHSEYTMIPHFVRIQRKHIPQDVFCCGSNIELFKALAAMNDKNDYYQWFVATLKPEHMVLNNSMDNNRLFTEPLFRKATAEEIVEHFKKMKV